MSIRAKKFSEVFSNFLNNSSKEKTQTNTFSMHQKSSYPLPVSELNKTGKRLTNSNSFYPRLKYKKGETSYSKLSEIRYISISLASSKTIRSWAEKTLPNGKILGLVTSADTLHYKTFKPLKGGLFCERIFGPLRDFECACGIQKRPTVEEYQKIVQHLPVERKFCSTCDVEYTWSIIRRYQLGYIELVTPVGHIWYSKGQPNYLSILLDWKKNDLDSFFYCTTSSTLEESLQIFNNPFRVDPGFTNPLFDVDWIDFMKPTKLKSVSWSDSILQKFVKYEKFKNLQAQKRASVEPKYYQKLNCYFLQNKLQSLLNSSTDHFSINNFFFLSEKEKQNYLNLFFQETSKRKETKNQTLNQNINLSLKSNMSYSKFYNLLLKKAMNLVYKKAYMYAHEKVRQKLFVHILSSSVKLGLETNFTSLFHPITEMSKIMIYLKTKNNQLNYNTFSSFSNPQLMTLKLDYSKNFVSFGNNQEKKKKTHQKFFDSKLKKLDKLFSNKNNQEKFLSWFQKELTQTQRLEKNLKTTYFPYKLFAKNLNKNKTVELDNLYQVLLKNKKFCAKVKKQKQHKLKFVKNMMSLNPLYTSNNKHISITNDLENLVKQIICFQLKERDVFLLFQSSNLKTSLLPYVLNKNFMSKLNFIGKIFANFIFYDVLKFYVKYHYKNISYLDLLIQTGDDSRFSCLPQNLERMSGKNEQNNKQNLEIILLSPQISNEVKDFRNLSEIKILEKEMNFKDLFFLRQKIRNKKFFNVLYNFQYYKSNYNFIINYLVSNVVVRFLPLYNLNIKKTLNYKKNFRKENSRSFSWWFLLASDSLIEQYSNIPNKEVPILVKKEISGKMTEILNLIKNKKKQNKILSFFYPTLVSSVKKPGVFYQKNINIKNVKQLKFTQTIAKKSFYWRFGFVLSRNYSNSNNNNKIKKIQYNLNLLVTNIVQSITKANQLNNFKKFQFQVSQKTFYKEKKRLNEFVAIKQQPGFSKSKQKAVQAYDSVSQNTSFLFYNPLTLFNQKKQLTKSNNMFNTSSLKEKEIQITGQNYKLLLLQILPIITNDSNSNLYNNKIVEFKTLTLNKVFSENKTKSRNKTKINEILENWVKNKFFEFFLNKKLLRFQYGFNTFSAKKTILRNSIYLLSSRERDFFYQEKRPVYLINYCRGYSNFDDIWLPIYQYKGLQNPLITQTGASILQRFLQEFDDLKELSKMEKQYRIELLGLEQKIRELKILGSFFMSIEERRKLEKFIKKQVYFLRKTKLIRKLFVKESKLSSTLLTTLPVLPPDLRPILKMQGQVAASDLNRLYQRVIYRNDRLKKLRKTSGCLPTDLKYAQRLLQEAVDNLIQNGKSGGSPEVDSRGRSLKSLSELLKGKQGRFRQNLLGKRVDYSGRSVIVVGPSLKIHECGLPKEIAVELFLPFLIQRILHYNFARTVIGAKSLIKGDSNLCSFLLAELMQSHPIYLNRAPTLHRLGIQAFQPKLIEGRAILLHPLVCPAFNADFDGDQMAVHLPLTVEARAEAWKLMLSRNHLISSGTGNPVMLPSQDMVLGCYYLTTDTLRPTTHALVAFSPSLTVQQKSAQPLDDSIASVSLSKNQKMQQHLHNILNLLINFYDFKNIAYSKSQNSKILLITDSMNNDTFITEKIYNQISLILTKARKQNISNQQNFSFSKYFNNFEQVTKAYEHQKLKIHSDIWVNWPNTVETFSPKSRSGKSSPLEIQVYSDGSWNEIRYKHIRHFIKNDIQINQYIRTTPGRVLFYNFIQNCIKDI